ncbi:MAG: hypothetical protein U0791_26855 [Gemmataceae bacterium]
MKRAITRWGKWTGAAGGRREQVAGAAEYVADALLMDRLPELVVGGEAVVGENAGPVRTDAFEDFGTRPGVDGVGRGPVTDPDRSQAVVLRSATLFVRHVIVDALRSSRMSL